MSKRQLTRQQRQRIAQQQQKALLDPEEPNPDNTVANSSCNGRIVSHYGQQLQVEILAGEAAGQLVLCHQRANLPSLVTGDLVVWDATDAGQGVIVAAAQRRNAFTRPDSYGREKLVAANLDRVLVVFAVYPQAFMNMIDRYLVAIENLGLAPLLVLNKTDLINDENRSDIDNILSSYQQLGYQIATICAETGAGMDALEASLAGLTTVFVGQSGVGKSSIINRLGGESLAAVGDLSVSKQKGTHTTTTARLFHLRQCDVIDSPGIRELRVQHLDAQQVTAGFIELRDLAGQCRFRNCTHQSEPGCALLAALESGAIQQHRWDSYQQILTSLESGKN